MALPVIAPMIPESDTLASFRVFATVPRGSLADSATDLQFRVVDRDSGSAVTHGSVFRGPQ